MVYRRTQCLTSQDDSARVITAAMSQTRVIGHTVVCMETPKKRGQADKCALHKHEKKGCLSKILSRSFKDSSKFFFEL